MEPNLTYVYPHTRIQSLVSILRTTVHHAFPVVTENRGNEKEFMKGNQLISNNIRFKVRGAAWWGREWGPPRTVHAVTPAPVYSEGPRNLCGLHRVMECRCDSGRVLGFGQMCIVTLP